VLSIPTPFPETHSHPYKIPRLSCCLLYKRASDPGKNERCQDQFVCFRFLQKEPKSYLEEEPVSELQDSTNAQIPPKDKDRLHFAPALFPLTHLFRHTDAEVKTSHGYHIIMVEGRK
jgi:hypothetical protein